MENYDLGPYFINEDEYSSNPSIEFGGSSEKGGSKEEQRHAQKRRYRTATLLRPSAAAVAASPPPSRTPTTAVADLHRLPPQTSAVASHFAASQQRSQLCFFSHPSHSPQATALLSHCHATPCSATVIAASRTHGGTAVAKPPPSPAANLHLIFAHILLSRHPGW